MTAKRKNHNPKMIANQKESELTDFLTIIGVILFYVISFGILKFTMG